MLYDKYGKDGFNIVGFPCNQVRTHITLRVAP